MIQDLDTLGEWLSGKGPESDIVISTRIRLARNVVEHPFLTRISDEDRSQLERYLGEQIRASAIADEVKPILVP